MDNKSCNGSYHIWKTVCISAFVCSSIATSKLKLFSANEKIWCDNSWKKIIDIVLWCNSKLNNANLSCFLIKLSIMKRDLFQEMDYCYFFIMLFTSESCLIIISSFKSDHLLFHFTFFLIAFYVWLETFNWKNMQDML